MTVTTPAAPGRVPDRLGEDPVRRNAAARLARYFAGFGLTGPDRLERLVGAVLASTPAHPPSEGGEAAADAALQAAEARVAAWFGRVLGREEAKSDSERRSAVVLAGRAAFLLCDGPSRWPDAFLREPPPDAFIAAMRAAATAAEPTPPPEPTVMPAQDLAFWSPAALLAPRLTRPAHTALGLLLGLAHGR